MDLAFAFGLVVFLDLWVVPDCDSFDEVVVDVCRWLDCFCVLLLLGFGVVLLLVVVLVDVDELVELDGEVEVELEGEVLVDDELEVVELVLDVGVVVVVEVGVVVELESGAQDSLSEAIVPWTGRLRLEIGVPGATSTLNVYVWPPTTVTVTVQESADAMGEATANIVANAVPRTAIKNSNFPLLSNLQLSPIRDQLERSCLRGGSATA